MNAIMAGGCNRQLIRPAFVSIYIMASVNFAGAQTREKMICATLTDLQNQAQCFCQQRGLPADCGAIRIPEHLCSRAALTDAWTCNDDPKPRGEIVECLRKVGEMKIIDDWVGYQLSPIFHSVQPH